MILSFKFVAGKGQNVKNKIKSGESTNIFGTLLRFVSEPDSAYQEVQYTQSADDEW